MPDEESHPLAGVAAYLFEAGHLKNLPRSGWLMLGIPQPESVAEHSFRVGLVGMTLAGLAGADVGHVAALCLVHDMAETRITDVASVARAYVTTAAPEAVTAHQVAGMPDELGKVFQALVAEYEAAETLESRVARDADKLETLLTAAEYGAQGYGTGPWREASINALRTDEGKQLARAIDTTRPGTWWQMFAASYAELRATAKQRSRGLAQASGTSTGAAARRRRCSRSRQPASGRTLGCTGHVPGPAPRWGRLRSRRRRTHPRARRRWRACLHRPSRPAGPPRPPCPCTRPACPARGSGR